MSKILFGNQDRLLVAAAVAESEPGLLFEQALAERAGIKETRVGPQLARLVDAGLLVRHPTIGSDRRVYYDRVDSEFWALCLAVRDEAVARSLAGKA